MKAYNRRDFLKMTAAGGISLSFPTLSPAKERNSRPPNVIFILADDMGLNDAGCYGGNFISTPNIDQMAAGGIRFTQHYAGAPVCSPSRSCLMTGQHTGHTFVRGNRYQVSKDSPLIDLLRDKTGRKNNDFPLRIQPKGCTTIAEIFKDAGYRTAIIGKWGMGKPGTTGSPLKVGFDEFFGQASNLDAHTYHPKMLWNNNALVPNPENRHVQPQYTDRALDFISRNKRNPFFLYLAYQTPHSPHKAQDTPEKNFTLQKNGADNNAAVYASQITQMDRGIGRILKQLCNLEIEHNTLVIFTSDNGAEGPSKKSQRNTMQLRGKKRDLYEGGLRVPMIAYWPGTIKAGRTSEEISAFWDFMPTFSALTSQPIPKQTDGLSLLPTLLGDEDKQEKHTILYFEWSGKNRAGQVIRQGDWKLIRWYKTQSPFYELYNLENDYSEKKNLATHKPELIRELTRLMDREHEPSKHFPLPFEMKRP